MGVFHVFFVQMVSNRPSQIYSTQNTKDFLLALTDIFRSFTKKMAAISLRDLISENAKARGIPKQWITKAIIHRCLENF